MTMIWQDGKVGIGTTNPTKLFHVNGASLLGGTTTILGNLLPGISSLMDIGTSSFKWRNLSLSGTADIDSTLTVGGGENITGRLVFTDGVSGGTAPSSGKHLELFYYDTNDEGYIQAYDRDANAYLNIRYAALTHVFTGNATVSGYLQATGNISTSGTGTITSASSLIAGGTLYVGENIRHTGDTNNYINFTTDTQKFFTDNVLALTIDSSQNVGIGTTNPSGYKLKVEGTTWLNDQVFIAGNNTAPPTTSNSQDFGAIRMSDGQTRSMYQGCTATYGWIQVMSSTNHATNYPLALNPNGGNVGIGTNAPGSLLRVEGSNATAYAGNAAQDEEGVTLSVWNQDETALGSYAALQLVNKGTGSHGKARIACIAPANNQGALAFTVENAGTFIEAMRILGDGKVGINMAIPGYKLDVYEQAGNEIARFAGANSGSVTLRNDAANVFRIYAGASDSLGFSAGNSYNADHLTIASDGKVGIGATTPFGKLEVAQDVAFSTVYNSQSDNIVLTRDATIGDNQYAGSIGFSPIDSPTERMVSIAGLQTAADSNQMGLAIFTHPSASGATDIVEALRIEHDGKVGIGTTAPAWKLHVLGNDGVAKIESSSTNSWLQLKGSTTYSWQIGATSSGLQFYSDAETNTRMNLTDGGQLKLNTYGSGTHTGTLAKSLGVDSSGNVIEFTGGTGTVTGTGTANYISKWTGTSSQGNSLIQDDGSTVGIGTNGSSGGKLQVYGGSIMIDQSGASSKYIVFQKGPIASFLGGSPFFDAYSYNAAGSADIARTWFTHSAEGTFSISHINTGTPAMALSIDTSANVGIGTTAPSQLLSVNGTFGIEDATISYSSGQNRLEVDKDLKLERSTGTSIYMRRTTADTVSLLGKIEFGNNNIDSNVAIISAYQGGATDAGELRFETEATGGSIATRMTIKSDGKVGIGTTAPSAALDVVTSSTVWAAEINQTNTSNGDGLYVNTGSTASADYVASFRANNVNVLAVKANGSVGIGTATPNFPLNIHGSGTDLRGLVLKNNNVTVGDKLKIGFDAAWHSPTQIGSYIGAEAINVSGGQRKEDLIFGTLDQASGGREQERVRIQYDGKVGIGTTNPGYLLDVNGTANIVGALTAGSSSTTNTLSGYTKIFRGRLTD